MAQIATIKTAPSRPVSTDIKNSAPTKPWSKLVQRELSELGSTILSTSELTDDLVKALDPVLREPIAHERDEVPLPAPSMPGSDTPSELHAHIHDLTSQMRRLRERLYDISERLTV